MEFDRFYCSVVGCVDRTCLSALNWNAMLNCPCCCNVVAMLVLVAMMCWIACWIATIVLVPNLIGSMPLDAKAARSSRMKAYAGATSLSEHLCLSGHDAPRACEYRRCVLMKMLRRNSCSEGLHI